VSLPPAELWPPDERADSSTSGEDVTIGPHRLAGPGDEPRIGGAIGALVGAGRHGVAGQQVACPSNVAPVVPRPGGDDLAELGEVRATVGHQRGAERGGDRDRVLGRGWGQHRAWRPRRCPGPARCRTVVFGQQPRHFGAESAVADTPGRPPNAPCDPARLQALPDSSGANPTP